MGFFERCEEIREEIIKKDNFLVIHHYDADGLSAGAITCSSLIKMGKDYTRESFKKIAENEVEEIKKRKEKNIIIVDLGGGAVEELEKLDKNIIILDHHQTKESSILQLNPHLFGYNGTTEMSGASTSYFAFGFKEFASMGVVGSVGDMQFPLVGMNRKMLDEGVEEGVVKCYKDISFFGRASRPLVPFIEYSTSPYFPNLTGNNSNVMDFYNKLGIELKMGEKWRSYKDLSDDEKEKLRSALVSYLYDKNRKIDAKNIISEVYELLDYPEDTEMRDSKEFSTLLNACGRHGQVNIGLDTMMKVPGAYEQAKSLLELHQRMLKEGIEYAQKKVVDLGTFYLLDARGIIEDTLVGVVAGMLYSSIPPTKPIIALSIDKDNGDIKVSGRATMELVRNGVDLGKSLEKVCEGIGKGGGHNIAAGARVEVEHVNLFIKRIGEEFN